jgi:peptidase C25-like protein/VCBS repeat protein
MKAVPTLLAAVALACVASVAAAGVIEREFRYPSERFRLVARDGATEVTMAGGALETAPGRPDLPLVGEAIELPAGMRVSAVEVTELETELLAAKARVLPAVRFKPGLEPIERTAPDPAFYRRVGFPGEPAAVLGYQGWQRGRGMALLQVRPVRWDAASGKLERVSRLRVRLTLQPDAGAAMVRRERIMPEWEEGEGGEASAAARAARVSVRRPEPGAQPFRPTQVPSVLGSPVAYVIVTTDDLAASFQPFADWKTQSGLPAVVRTLSFIRQEYPFGADDADRIRTFLRDAYARWGTKWVLLGGDTEKIPTRLVYSTFYGGEHIAADLYFSCLEGNWNADGDSLYGEGYLSASVPGDGADLLPEVYVGRAPVTTTAQVDRFISKNFRYTRNPVGDYEKRHLYFAEVLFPPTWTEGEATTLDGAELMEECLPSIDANPSLHAVRLYQNNTDSRWRPGALKESRQAVIDSLSAGYNFAVHVGHGYRNVMSVGDASLVNEDADALTNGDRLTNLYTSNCTTNAIDYPCIAEAFMNAPTGGAVTFIGCSRFDFPQSARRFQVEYFRLLFEDSVTAVGEAQAKQKLPFITFSNSDSPDRWSQMTLLMLGDPEVRLWTGTPRALSVSHPLTMSVRDTAVRCTVTIAGQALQGARVTAYKAGDEYRSVTTDGAGIAVLDFRPDSVGSFNLTATAYDCRPYLGAMLVTSSSSQAVLVERVPILNDNDDDGVGGRSGNNNQILDAGETVDIRIPIKNQGGTKADSVIGRLTTTDPLVTVVAGRDTVHYGDVAAAAVANGSGWFRIQTPYITPDQREIPFTLTLSDVAGRRYVESLRLTLRAPEPRHFSHTVAEQAGNGNARPDSGEIVNYFVTLRNLGTGSGTAISAVLRRLDGRSQITDSTAAFGTLAPGVEVQGDAFTFEVLDDQPAFELRISNAPGGLLHTQTIDVIWPAKPVNLAVVGSGTTAELTWARSAASDLMGYNVYRSTNVAGPYVKINRVPTDRSGQFKDEGIAPLTTYYYKVSAVDSSGNESSQSTTASVTTSPPYHTVFPVTMGRTTPSSVATARIYNADEEDIVAGADVLYLWHADGTAPVDADGEGATSGDFTSLGDYYAAGPSVSDLDGVGGMDIVATTWTSKSVYAFDKQGQLKPGWPFAIPAESWSIPALGDLDGNGTKEVLFGINSNTLYALRSNGTEWIDGDNNAATPGVFKSLPGGPNFGTPALVDLDGNGKLDIIYGDGAGWLHAWRPDGSYLPGFPIALGGQISSSVAVGPLDGAGDPELDIVVSVSGVDLLYVIGANGGQHAGFPKQLITRDVSRAPSPALADINGDGYLDIVAASTTGLLYAYDRNGALLPGFTNLRFSTLTSSASESSPVVADITGDRIPDIVMGDENQTLNGFSGTGAKLPGFPIVVGGEIRGTPALCDCDGDGLSEIVMSGWDQKLYVWDYDFAYSPAGPAPWPQFHHDASRRGDARSGGVTDVTSEVPAAPAAVELAAPMPNPARGAARLRYAVPSDRAGQALEVAVFDLRGRRIRTLARGAASPGWFSAHWNLRDDQGAPVGHGVYFLRFVVGDSSRSRKLVVMP